MTGIVLIIPGMRQTAADVAYCAVGGCYSAKGIALVFIDVDWGFTGLNDLAVTTSAMEAEVRKTHSIIEHRKSAFARSKVVIVKGAGHELGPSYLEAIKAAVQEISIP
jgi:hypothetical protein